jgi:hypothetical protein
VFGGQLQDFLSTSLALVTLLLVAAWDAVWLSGTSSNIGHAAIATTPLHDGVCIYHCMHVSAVWCLQQLVLPSPTMARRQHHTAMPGGAPLTTMSCIVTHLRRMCDDIPSTLRWLDATPGNSAVLMQPFVVSWLGLWAGLWFLHDHMLQLHPAG